MSSAFCRTALIERLLHSDADDQQSAPLFNSAKCWTNIDLFVKDNLAEVHRKLANIEEEIWAKIIIMEKGVRTAKAYLRSQLITVDGSDAEFDGFRIGVNRFTNFHRDQRTAKAIRRFSKGIKIKIDESGSIWLRCIEGSIRTRGMFGDVTVYNNVIKVFDLKLFRDIVSQQTDFDDATKNRLNQLAITYIMTNESNINSEPLKCPLWFTIIHLIAIEMAQILITTATNNTSGCDTQSTSTSADELHKTNMAEMLSFDVIKSSNHSSNFKLNQHSNDDSVVASSSNGTNSNSPYSSNRKSRGGALRRINHRDHSPIYSSSNQNERSMNDFVRSRQLGRSLIDLSELDYLRNPVYFKTKRETRGGSGHPKLYRVNNASQTNRFHDKSNNNNNYHLHYDDWRSKSETSLYCERF